MLHFSLLLLFICLEKQLGTKAAFHDLCLVPGQSRNVRQQRDGRELSWGEKEDTYSPGAALASLASALKTLGSCEHPTAGLS